MRLKLISCEILFREMSAAVAESEHFVDAEFLPKGLHDIAGEGMCQRIQEVLDCVDESVYDAVILGYALCGMGLRGLTARGIPVVLPRGHDCITLFLGSRQRYLEYFYDNPGVYFKTGGWIERGKELQQLNGHHFKDQYGLTQSFEEMVAKYGEDNAKYLWEQLGGYTKNYGKLTFITMGIGPEERFEEEVRKEAAEQKMNFEKVQGDMGLFHRLVNGKWEGGDFLVLQPGHRVIAKIDDDILDSEPVSPSDSNSA